jgi:hypothetical protein
MSMSDPFDMHTQADDYRRTNNTWLLIAAVAIFVLGIFAWFTSDDGAQQTRHETPPMATTTDGSPPAGTPPGAPAGGRS